MVKSSPNVSKSCLKGSNSCFYIRVRFSKIAHKLPIIWATFVAKNFKKSPNLDTLVAAAAAAGKREWEEKGSREDGMTETEERKRERKKFSKDRWEIEKVRKVKSRTRNRRKRKRERESQNDKIRRAWQLSWKYLTSYTLKTVYFTSKLFVKLRRVACTDIAPSTFNINKLVVTGRYTCKWECHGK